MKIRNQITVYFSLTTLLLTGIAFIFIYFLFSQKREGEFQMRQKDKITTTLKLLAQIKQTDNELVEELDLLTIHDLYDEKLLLFNNKKELIYSSIDDIPITFSSEILSQLSGENKWEETKDGLYDVIGVYVESNGKIFFGISKAYDTFGYSKLVYLKYILSITFFAISVILVFISVILSKRITEPLASIAQQISEYNFEESYSPIAISESKSEVHILAMQFNKLMKRMNEVFSFQKHAIHHISHELKTPISVLVSNFEKIENESDINKIKLLIKNQKEDTKSLSEIINSLLEISKTESGSLLKKDRIRIDELIFDVAEELKNIHPDFNFTIKYTSTTNSENLLIIEANARLIKSALINLMQNCIQYSNDNAAIITIKTTSPQAIQLMFENNGNIIGEAESKFLFQHFFRGQNSKGKRGFGLGLVLTKKIAALHNGSISYSSKKNTSNTFTLTLPLS